MIPRFCSLCGLIANRNTSANYAVMTRHDDDVDFIGSCADHLVTIEALVGRDSDVEWVTTIRTDTFRMVEMKSSVKS